MSDKKIRVSVRELVEYVLRSGDIDHNYVSSSRMQDGVRIHQKLQKKRLKKAALDGSLYEKEYPLAHSFFIDDFEFTVEGRADGILRKDGKVSVEEIKSTLSDVNELNPDENHVHFAQAKCYAYIICLQESLEDIGVILTYCNVETEETKEIQREYTFAELVDFFSRVTETFFLRAKKDHERKQARDSSIRGSAFVYDNYRQGQREFAVKVYRAIENRCNLFAQAPTGTGKTISTIFPCVKAIGEGMLQKIFYLTAKTVTRQVAEEAVTLLNKRGYDILTVTFTAKEKICLSDECLCLPEICKYAKGHFDRVNRAVDDICENERIIKRSDIQAYAKKHCVCPHEFTLDISLWADIIICDYNHVFDPKVRLKRFFGDMPSEDYVFLVDEAHNLVDRSRDMFSCELGRQRFLDIKKELKPLSRQLYKLCDDIDSFFTDYKADKFENSSIMVAVIREPPEKLDFLLRDFLAAADKFLAMGGIAAGDTGDKLLSLYFLVLDYISVSEAFSKEYCVLSEASGSDIVIKLLCLDPSEMLSEVHRKARASVFFSATLTPVSYFRRILGGYEYDDSFRLPSPFPEYNLCLVIESGISTRYKDRMGSYDEIAERLFIMVSAKKGNYFAFFPSYAYLNEVMTSFKNKYPGINVLVQEQKLSDKAKEDFLKNFQDGREDTLLAFSVMGGVFSEGIDLTGERLIGVAVIGVGLPLISAERDIIKGYYDENLEYGAGFDYAYVYPGINKVMQAAGRLIRTETDRGVIMLIDERYHTEKYRSLFPKEWNNAIFTNDKETLENTIKNFWR